MRDRLIEMSPVRDTFVTNIGTIEILNSCARFILYVDRDGQREVVAKIVIPIENVPSAIALTIATLSRHWLDAPAIGMIGLALH